MYSRLDAPAEFFTDKLHSIADAKNRNTEFQNSGIADGSICFVHRCGTARQNDALGVVCLQFVGGGVKRKNLGIDVCFPNPAADKLCILSTEIEDENRF